MLIRSKYLAQHRKDGDIVFIEWGFIVSPAEDQIVAHQLTDLHYRIAADNKQHKDYKHIDDNKKGTIPEEDSSSPLKRLSISPEVERPADSYELVNAKR